MESIDRFKGKYRFLSNFEPCKILYEGMIYSAVEHAFQASKATNEHDRKMFGLFSEPAEAKKLGKQISLRSDWEDVKVSIMYEFLNQKFHKPEFMKLLMGTEGRYLVEGNNHGDIYWGQVNGAGKNTLGKLIMQIREEIKQEFLNKWKERLYDYIGK